MDAQAISEAARCAEQEYLARLDQAACAAAIGGPGREDLRALVKERFTLARAESSYSADPLSVVLDTAIELGDPQTVAARARAAWPDALAPELVDLTGRERAAMVGLALGWLTAGIGLIVAAVMLSSCRRWTRAERIAGFLAALILPPLAAINLTPLIFSQPWPTLSVVLLIASVGGVPVAMHGRLRRRYGVAR